MLRGLHAFREQADQPSWQAGFDNRVTVITATISMGTLALWHWTTIPSDGKVGYHSMHMKSWVTIHEDWVEISQSLTNAIFMIIKNKPWIISEISKIHESLKVQRDM